MLAALTSLLALGLLAFLFSTWAANPEADIAERNVMTTTSYSLTGAMVVNVVCAVVVRGVKAVPAGDEMGACSPYGLIGAGISARLHLFYLNGYTHGEWAYVREVPSRTMRLVDTGIYAAKDYLEELLGGSNEAVVDKTEL
ncbi:hypothetical protein B0I35DRAFT_435152 [Stachybotrys elegans]|uniref:Uncharacterized protein n=1 Tax=Stachybotrys elegans TaxID=80388 RepID=A0A8K0SNF3_9HYPO|nr:hypothetical protein B0I35DRAFT_435152 [Stachybotrys elegans]